MKKNIFIATIILAGFFLNLNIVTAQPISEACSDPSKCIVLCNYMTKLKGSGKSYDPMYKYRNITFVYYYENKEIAMYYQTLSTDGRVLNKKGAVDYIFSKSGINVYWGGSRNLSLSQFTCPANGYYDTDDWNGGNEFCFDDDGATCHDVYSNIGTSFAKGIDFISEEKDYDYESDITAYATNFISRFKSDITSGKFKIAEELEKTIVTDFQTNYLNGNAIPEFIINSNAYKNIVNDIMNEFKKAAKEEVDKSEETKEDKLKKAKEEYDKKIERLKIDLRHNVITQEDYDKNVQLAKEEYDKKVAEINGEYKEIVENWGACANDEELEQAKKQLTTTINGAKSQLRHGIITQEMYDIKEKQAQEIYDKVEARYSPDCKNADDIEEILQATFTNLEANITWLADFDISDYCKSYLGSPEVKSSPAYYLQFVFNLMKYAAIVLLLVFTIIEFIKATVSSNQDAMKKAIQNSVKRLIIAVIIFFLPILIKFLLTLLGAYSPGTCGIS